MAQLDPATVAELLDRLGSDEGFRGRFTRSVSEALAELGVTDFSDEVCLQVAELASMEQIRAARARLEEQLTAPLDQQPLHLEAAAHRD
jgi:putative modified peptide